MRTRARFLRAWTAVAVLTLAACGSDGDGAAATNGATTTTIRTAGDDVTAAESRPGRSTTSRPTSSPTSNPTSNPTTTTSAAATAPTTTVATTTVVPPTTTTRPAPTTTPATTAPPPATTTAPTTAPPSAGPTNGTRDTSCEQSQFDQINAARAAAGQPTLANDPGIQDIPLGWSDHMAGTQQLQHNPDYGGQIAARRSYTRAGENVGRGPNSDVIFTAFMNSEGHRRNIESPHYTHVAVGCVRDGGGQLWITQNFWG